MSPLKSEVAQAEIRVEPFAQRVLWIARALVGERRWDLVEPLLEEEFHPVAHRSQAFRGSDKRKPEGMSAAGIRALQDTLARGSVRELARRGAWVPRRLLDLDGAERTPRRVWQRHGALSLHFSVSTHDTLIALANWPRLEDARRVPQAMAQTPADEWVLYLICGCVEAAGSALGWLAERVRASPLCWLAFPDLLIQQPYPGPPTADAPGPATLRAPSAEAYARWFSGPGLALIEALQSDLSRRWLEMEHQKRTIHSIDQMIALGRAQHEVLDAWCTACDRANRRDLVTFAIDAGTELLRHPVPSWRWVHNLANTDTLARRGDARAAAAAFLRALLRLESWDSEHRMIRHFEDDYERAQLLLRAWEPMRGAPIQHARRVITQLDRPMNSAADDEPIATEPSATEPIETGPNRTEPDPPPAS